MIDPQILSLHLMLLNDVERMEKYRHAVFKTVKSGDVVLDIGTGSGILAMFACQAGAKRVYAIDRGDIIAVARELSKTNGFSDRIVFLREDIRQVELEEQVDAITSELIAKAVLGQNMAELIGFSRDRFLKPGGKILPAHVNLHIAPIENEGSYKEAKPPVKSTYDLDFAPLEKLTINKPVSARASSQSVLAQGQIAYEYDALTAKNSDTFQCTLVFKPERSGMLHGFAGWFSTMLAEGIELCNEPPGTLSWDNLFFPLAQPTKIEPGMTIELDFRGRCDSQVQEFWIWNTTVRDGERVIARYRQSSFAGRIVTAEMLRRASDDWSPTTNLNGRIAKFVLDLMNQRLSLGEIADRIRQEFPEKIKTAEDAISHVRKLAEQFGD